MLRIGVTGGIGSGKSIVCTLFNRLGAPVYNSDARAKELTNSSPQIIDGIIEIFGEQSYLNGVFQRKYIASQVFADSTILAKLNGLIHPVIAEDFNLWCRQMESVGAVYVILESAILFESGFASHVDEVICVSAPVQVRISRVVNRDCLTSEEVQSRINNQLSDIDRRSRSKYNIVNDGHSLIMPQIVKLNAIFGDEKV